MAGKKEKLEERTIRVRAFVYYVDGEDPTTGDTIRLERLARRGEKVQLREQDIARGEREAAFVPEDAPEHGGETLDPLTADVSDLAAWIREDGPSESEVVDASEGNGTAAQKLLDAETEAKDGDPRQGVVDGLTEVIRRDNE